MPSDEELEGVVGAEARLNFSDSESSDASDGVQPELSEGGDSGDEGAEADDEEADEAGERVVHRLAVAVRSGRIPRLPERYGF